ncbi:D-alanyl-D-alanine carboxypeptidase family protein [Ligilactobacillus sp. LYQ60]|uniref:D-alanyl-D-alanine carboxypeptidase family protein n=1 Tax=unclassified Ligilactobacillus TaxID=2767920 RepID=UPI0038526505
MKRFGIMVMEIAFLTLIALGGALPASAARTEGLRVNQANVRAAMVVDNQTGQILATKNSRQVVPIASLTKLVTLYIVVQQIKTGKLRWNQRIVVSKAAAGLTKDKTLMNVPLTAGKKYRVRDLFQAALVCSANDAAQALADVVSHNHPARFAAMMRAQLCRWGIKDAKMYTANGLDNGDDGADRIAGVSKAAKNQLSARDLVIVTQHLLRADPQILTMSQQRQLTFAGRQYQGSNQMLPGGSAADPAYHVLGLKTGSTKAAGQCFVGVVDVKGRRLITVVLGVPNKEQNARFSATKQLLDQVTNNYRVQQIAAHKAVRGARTIRVVDGHKYRVKVVPQRGTAIWVHKGSRLQKKLTPITSCAKNNQVIAPVVRYQRVGTLNVTTQGLQRMDGTSTVKLPVEATQATTRISWWARLIRSI